MIQRYIEEFKKLPTSDLAWLQDLKKKSINNLEKKGFPTQRLEEWKDINLTPITSKFYPASTKKNMSVSDGFWKNSPHIIFSNGFRIQNNLGNINGCAVSNLKDGLKSSIELQKTFALTPKIENTFYDLNTSMVQEGLTIQIKKNTQITKPIYLIYVSASTQQASYYRTLIHMEVGSQAKIVEIYLTSDSSADALTSSVTQIVMSPQSKLEHVKLQDESLKTSHTGLIIAKQLKQSRLDTFSFSFGAEIARNDIYLNLAEEGAEGSMDGLYVPGDNQVVDHHTIVEHTQPHCNSWETYKGVLLGSSHAVFEGKIIVAKQAQKTDAQQLNQNLLMSSNARVNAAPQLEILADDVKCSHGATIGKLDEDQVFYLRSRGIPLETARQMLVQAYADAIISKITIPELVDDIHTRLNQKIFASTEKTV